MSQETTNQQLKEKLLESIEKVEHWVNFGENTLAEQTPLVIKEIINLGLYYHSAGIFLGMFLALVSFAFLFCRLKNP